MGKLKNIKLSPHARQRLEERKTGHIIYNTKNLMKSSCKWYTREDIIEKTKLYQHSLYVCRKSPQLDYMTDGEVEVLYNKGTGVALTVMEIKEKFKPVTQYIKPNILEANKIKKENKKMKSNLMGTCPDCERENVELTSQGICTQCRTRKYNAKVRGKEYVPYKNLSKEEKEKIIKIQAVKAKKTEEEPKEIPIPDMTIPDNFYQVKAENNPTIAVISPKNIESTNNKTNPSLTDFIETLRNCGCEIPEKDLSETLKVLIATDTMKDAIITITKDANQQALLDLEQMLNVCERKLQHIWEFNGFREEDDRKFKDFLTWRRTLKGAMFFWKKLYQSNALIELQRAWHAYTADPSEKITLSSDKDKTTSAMKRYQITTETISTIYNTRRGFTRVFYAASEQDARTLFTAWLAERQLHEDKTKTTIVELSNQGERVVAAAIP